MPLSDQQRRRLSLRLANIAKKIDRMLLEATDEKMAFSLVIWGKMGEDNMIQYVANAHREDCAKYMRELVERWERGDEDPPYHERQ